MKKFILTILIVLLLSTFIIAERRYRTDITGLYVLEDVEWKQDFYEVGKFALLIYKKDETLFVTQGKIVYDEFVSENYSWELIDYGLEYWYKFPVLYMKLRATQNGLIAYTHIPVADGDLMLYFKKIE